MKKSTLCLLVLLFFDPLSLFSQNEFLDQDFGSNGIIFQNYIDPSGSGLESDFKSIVLQADGSFITASNFHLHGADPRYIINRYSKSGSLDLSFGVNGFVTGSLQNNIGSIELQSTGKIIGLAVGGIYPSYNSYIFRLNTDGLPDNAFGTNGTITDPVNIIRSISIQPDDGILVAKMPTNARVLSGLTVVRYKPDGALDTDFGNNGTINFSLPDANITLNEIIGQKDGKILISGTSDAIDPNDYRRDILLVRLNDNGSPDTTFGEGGVRILNFDDVDDTVNVLVQSDGKTIISSSSYQLIPGSSVVNRLLRLNVNGDMDNTFGLDGIKPIEYPILSLQSLKELPNGKLMTAGTYETGENPTPENNHEPTAIVLARYNLNGDLDLDFGNNGYITTTRTNSRAIDSKIIIQSDGKTLAGATFCESWFSCHPHTVVFRYNPGDRLSASEFVNNNAFLLYPNPFNETATIDFTISESEVLSMDLYSTDGRKVANLLKDQNFVAGFNSQKLDFPGTLAAGIYFLTVSNGEESTNVRVVKK